MSASLLPEVVVVSLVAVEEERERDLDVELMATQKPGSGLACDDCQLDSILKAGQEGRPQTADRATTNDERQVVRTTGIKARQPRGGAHFVAPSSVINVQSWAFGSVDGTLRCKG